MPRESTSAKVAAAASRLVSASTADLIKIAMNEPETIRSVAASALTQREPLMAKIKRLLSRG